MTKQLTQYNTTAAHIPCEQYSTTKLEIKNKVKNQFGLQKYIFLKKKEIYFSKELMG